MLKLLREPILLLILGTIISLCISLGLVETSRAWGHTPGLNPIQIVMAIIVLLAALLIPALFIILAVAGAFRSDTKKRMLGVALVAYFCCAVVFAGFYYSIQGLQDENDAELQIIHYQYEAAELSIGTKTQIAPYKSHRAFNGIEKHFYRNIEDDIPDITDRYGKSAESVAEIVGQYSKAIEFQPQNRLEVFLDCLHFSIMTITTVGYGDITPRIRIAKIASEIEVLVGLSLFVVALGMIFGNWYPIAKA